VSGKLDEARELACDERAIQRGCLSPAEYGRHLVDVVTATRGRLALGGALAIARTPLRLERRIDRLLDEPWSRRAGWIRTAALALLAAASLVALAPAREVEARMPGPLTSSPAGESCYGSAVSTCQSCEEACFSQSCGAQ
jgi:hypothetical protein